MYLILSNCKQHYCLIGSTTEQELFGNEIAGGDYESSAERTSKIPRGRLPSYSNELKDIQGSEEESPTLNSGGKAV